MGSSIREMIDRAKQMQPRELDTSKLEPEVLDAIDGDRHEGCGGFLSDRSPRSVPYWQQGSYNNPRATRGELEHRAQVPVVVHCAKCKRLYRTTSFRIEQHEENGSFRVEGYEKGGVFYAR